MESEIVFLRVEGKERTKKGFRMKLQIRVKEGREINTLNSLSCP